MKKRNIIIILIVYILYYISVNYNINIFYPYYLLKDYIIYPARALIKDNVISLSDEMEDIKISNLEEEIVELKKLTRITNILTDYNYINASVIERNREYWFNSITINKGSKDGIEMDMAVIDGDGLIGRIANVRKYTSDIKLITTNDINSKISVVIKGNSNIYGITKGYNNQKDLLKIIVDNDIGIKEGLNVETTGMGGVFPKGILIGKVDKVIEDNDNVGYIVLVKLSSNIKDLRYVSILQRKEILDN